MKFFGRFIKKFSSTPDGGNKADPNSTPTYQVQLSEAKEPPPKKVPDRDQIVLELGDFLHRIPAQLLLAGPHDLKTEIRFNPQYLSERIANGETTIPLAEIYNRIPTIFRGQIRETDQVEIRFPWQKIARLFTSARMGNEATADASTAMLAAKLRAKMPARKGPAQSPVIPSGAPAPILPGRSTAAATWFSKPVAEQAVSRLGNAPSPQPEFSEQIVEPAPPPGAEPPQASLSETPSLMMMPPREPATGAPPQGDLFDAPPSPTEAPVATSDADANLTIPAPADPGTATVRDAKEVQPSKLEEELRISDLPADLQRRIARFKGHHERQIGELERVRKNHTVEVARLNEELQKTRSALTDEKIAASSDREMTQTAQAERDRVQNEAAELKKKLAAVEDQSRISEIIAERDALQQQKAHLSAQVVELGKRAGTTAKGHEANGGTGNRQADELQRRIAHMESAQRETALELAREKEARSKAEKLLVSAEKLQEQSATYMETTKVEMRKEIESSVKAREIEFRKVQKELNDQVAALSGQLRIASTDLENANHRIAGLEAERQSAVPSPRADFHARMIAQLEEDIGNYRERMKILIAERDSARQEAQQAKPAPAADDSAAVEELARLREAHVRLDMEREQALVAFAAERAGFESRSEALRQALDAARDAYAMQIAAIQNERAGEQDAALSEARRHADEVARVSEERGARIADLEAEITMLKTQLSDAVDGQQKLADSANEDALGVLREQNSTLEQRLAALSLEHGNLAEQISNSTSVHAAVVRALQEERAEAVRVGEELRKQIADLERASSNADTLEAQTMNLTAQLAAANAEKDRAIALLDAEKDTISRLEREVTAAADEAGRLRDTLTSTSAVQSDHSKLSSELAELQRVTAALERDRADRDARLQAVEAEMESKNRNLGQVNSALAVMEEDIISARRVYAETAAELAAEKQRALSIRAEMQQPLDSAMRALVSVRTDAVETARHRDELLREIARLNDQQQMNLNETDVSIDLATVDAEPGKPADFIEIVMPEVLHAEIPNKISIPFARPVPVPPPRVNRG